MRMWLAGLVFCFVGCAMQPRAPQALRDAQDESKLAVRSTAAGDWQLAERHWDAAAKQYSALDDWLGTGRALLGKAQVLLAEHRSDEARAELGDVLTAARYPAEIKAEAHYQLALMAMDESQSELAAAHLDQAVSLIGVDESLHAAIWNAHARLAAVREDWHGVERCASEALLIKNIDGVELANAKRLLANAALHRDELDKAEALLTEAMVQDHQAARARSILADLRLMSEISKRKADGKVGAWEERARAVCAALGASGCQHDKDILQAP